MKICQLCAVDFTLKKFLLPLIDAQHADGNNVVAVCSDGEYVKGMREDGYRIVTISIERSMHPLKHLGSIWKLFWCFRRESFDVVHVHTPVAALLGRVAAFLARVPMVVYTAHGFYFHDDMPSFKRWIYIGLEIFAGRFTDLLFTQSSEDAKTAINEGIMPKHRVFAIGNGVDIKRFQVEKVGLYASLNIPKDSFVVGMIGRLVEEKGVVEFLNAAMLVAVDKPNVYFVLVGDRLASDHAAAVDEAIEEAAKTLGERLILTGLRDDIPDLLSLMDVFCLPSWREGMPRTIIEAMILGLPVVATNIRGSREEVISNETGLLVPVREPTLLASAITRLVDNPSWSKELGERGRERALELYDENKVVSLQVNLIKKFFAKK